MGISALNPFLREKCPEAFKDLPYSYFRGKRVAVDSDNVLRKLMSRSHKEIVNKTDVCTMEPDRKAIVDRWLYHVKEELVKFLRNGITLIFVFDGSYIDEKSATQTKRKEAKQKMIKDAEELKKKVLEVDELERTPQMITDLRKKMHHLGSIKPEEKELICKILTGLGIPILYATEEGEKLCAMLCIEGLVDAVYSRDTDVVAMGCPLSFSEEAGWIYNQETKRSEMALKCTIFRPILQSLNMEYSTFLDLALMAGCDFNSNIPRIAIGTAYKLLSTYKNIDNLPESYDEKKKILNHVRCRQIFARQPAKEICKGEVILNINLNALRTTDKELFQKYEIEDWIQELKLLYSMFPEPSNLFIEKPPSYNSSSVKLKILKRYENDVNGEVGKDVVNEDVNGDIREDIREVGNDVNEVGEFRTITIPKQKASPKKVTQKMITNLNALQIQRFKDKEIEKNEVKKIIKLKIIS